jgi:SAM-dependent methyltransferase
LTCCVCKSEEYRVLFEGRDRIFGIPGTFHVVRCEACGLLFIHPQPDSGTLKKYYPEAYYAPHPTPFREYSQLKKEVLRAFYGYGKGTSLLRKLILLPFRSRYRNSIPFVEKGRLLDIGCGNGTELYKLKKMGWEVFGVEMDEEASARARGAGLEVMSGNLSQTNYPDRFFHAVRLSFVLEHLPDPRETLLEVNRILLPHGRIYISIQNAGSLYYWLFRKYWFSLDVPRHLFSFSIKTIQRLLSSLDFRIKTIQFDSGTRTFLGSLQFCLNEWYDGKALVQRKQPILESHFLRHLFQPFCWCVDRLHLGDLIHLEIVKS